MAAGRRAVPSSVETVATARKEGPSLPWHLQHLLVSSKFPRAKPDSPLCEVRASHVAPVCECTCRTPASQLGVYTVIRCIRMHDIRWEHDMLPRRVDAEVHETAAAGCMCATRNLYLIEPRSGKR